MPVKYGEFNVLLIRQIFKLGLRPCTVCCKSANITSHSIAHNAWCIYTDTFNHTTTTKNHHRHHQKTTTTQCKLLERKYGICASGWKEKHHQRKLQWVKPPCVQVEYLCQLLREKYHHRKLVPVTTTIRTRCKGQGAGGVHALGHVEVIW